MVGRLGLISLVALTLQWACSTSSDNTQDTTQPEFVSAGDERSEEISVDDLNATDLKPDFDVAPDIYVPREVAIPGDVEPDLGGPNDTVEVAPDESSLPDLADEDQAIDVLEETADDDAPVQLKTAGQACEEFTECADGMSCISGQYTIGHCNPMCEIVQDCLDASPGTNPQCMNIGGYQICIWYCGMMGGTCPGDLTCDGATCG